MNLNEYEPKPGDTITITFDFGRDFFVIRAAMNAATEYWKDISGDIDDDIGAALYALCTYYGRDHHDALTVTKVENHWDRYALTDAATAEVREMVDNFRAFHAHAPSDQKYAASAIAYLKQWIEAAEPEPEPEPEPGPLEIQPTVTNSYVFTLSMMSKYLFDPRAKYDSENSISLPTAKDVLTYVYVNPNGADHLDATDERVHNALISVWEAAKGTAQRGICTLTDLTRAAGFPNCGPNRKLILEHLDRMERYEIVIDAHEEAEAHLSYTPTDAKGRLIAFNRIPVKVNGKVTDQAIRFLEPFLLTYCRNHGKQLSSAKHAVVEYPLRLSNATVALAEYLNKQLAWQSRVHAGHVKKLANLLKADPVDETAVAKVKRKAAAPTVVLFSTLYEVAQANLKDRKQLARICEYAETILNHYQAESIHRIASVNRGKDRFKITFKGGE